MKIEGGEERRKRERESHRILRRRIDAIFLLDGSWKYLWMAQPHPHFKTRGPLNAKIG